MRQTRALPWAVTLLDDGLRLYRRHLAGFLLVGSVVLIPLAILGIIFATVVRNQLGEGWDIMGSLGLALVQYPALMYASLALARTADAALEGRRLKLWPAFRLRPTRVVGMGCYGIALTVVAGLSASVLVFAVACPLLYAMLFGAGFLGNVAGSGLIGVAEALLGVLFGLILLATVLLTGALFATLAYAVQAFALEDRSSGSAISRSLDLLMFRLGRNLLVFIGAGAIIGTLLAAYTGTILAGTAGLMRLLDIELAPVSTRALQSALTTLSWVLLLPPLPIWMAMLHRSLAEERDGSDLIAATEQWRAQLRDAKA